jgi:sugar transferase (PEP-CTERM/EpsH1 system associated)
MTPSQTEATRPLVLHVLYRFATGGLENGVVNLLNHLPEDRLRHAVLAIDTVDPAFTARVRRGDVEFHALHKPPGHAFKLYPRVYRLLRELRPAIVHTRNLAALELQLPAALARVPLRIHGEHGRDVEDLHGENRRLQRLRRVYSPLVHRYVTVSRDLRDYLVHRVGIDAERIEQIYNGVDAERFHPAAADEPALPGCPFDARQHWIVGTVGRLQAVKNQALLVRAFARALQQAPAMRADARLVVAGDGPLAATLAEQVAEQRLGDFVWLAGERSDTPALMRSLALFVLPSLGEGISNTILEAMASGLPVLATAVGGNVELVQPGVTGELVPSDDEAALADALVARHRDRAATAALGRQARKVAEAHFSLGSMAEAYRQLYLPGTRPPSEGADGAPKVRNPPPNP